MKNKRIISFVLMSIMLVASVTTPTGLFSFASDSTKSSSVPESWEDVETEEWMKYIDGSKKITDINMPGTHDSATQHVTKGFEDIAQCQNLSIETQLRRGVRYLDIRLKNDDDKPYESDPRNLRLVHGTVDCLEEGNNRQLSFDVVLDNYVRKFLYHNPSETIVMCINEQPTSTSTFADELYERYIMRDPDLWILGNESTTLDEARGKVVLIRRYDLKKGNKNIGLDFTDWVSSSMASIKINSKEKAYIQDNYNSIKSVSEKWDVFEKVLKECETGKYNGSDKYLLNFSSANTSKIKPVEYAMSKDGMNSKIKGYKWKSGTKYGWIVMDFIDEAMAKAVYESNVFRPTNAQLIYKGMREDSQNYYFSFGFDRKFEGSSKRISLMMYLKSDRSEKNGIVSYIRTEKETYEFKVKKSQLYENQSYVFEMCEVDNNDERLSNLLTWELFTKDSFEKPVDLDLPQWASVGPGTQTAWVNYWTHYKFSGSTYFLNNKTTGKSQSDNLSGFEVSNDEIGDEFQGIVEHGPSDKLVTKYSQQVTYQPKIIGYPSGVTVDNITYDSAVISWDYDNKYYCWDFEIVVTDKITDQNVQTVYADIDERTTEIVGLKSDTSYNVQVNAIAPHISNPSDSVTFETNKAPNLIATPVFNYITKDNTSTDLQAGFKDSSGINLDELTYQWYHKAKSDSGDYQEIIGATGSSLTYSPVDTEVMEVICKATLNNNDEIKSNRAFVYKAPESVSSFTATAISLTSIKLSWDNSMVKGETGYRIEYGSNSIEVPADENSVTITDLNPGTEYVFKICTLGLGNPSVESDAVSLDVSTLNIAKEPIDAEIIVSPDGISSYDKDIVYTATATSTDGGILTYQWQMTDDDCAFQDINGATSASYNLKPDEDNFGKKIRCMITNNLNGTTASTTTVDKNIQYAPPSVSQINAAPTDSKGAVSIDVKWENPTISQYYIVRLSEASDQRTGYATKSGGDDRYEIVSSTGIKNDSNSITFQSLNPSTTYNIQIENVIKDQSTGTYIPADISSIKTTKVRTLEGADMPIITDGPKPTTEAIKGDDVNFAVNATVSSKDKSEYSWNDVTSDVSKQDTLSNGTVTGTQKLEAKVKAEDEKNGHYYYARVTSERNGDVRVAYSTPSVLSVKTKGGDADDNNDDKESGSNDKESGKDGNGSEKSGSDTNKSDSGSGSGYSTGDNVAFWQWTIIMLLAAIAFLRFALQRKS